VYFKLFFERYFTMSINDNPPESWPRFVNLIKQNMPRAPQMARSRRADMQTDLSRGWAVLSTLLDAAGLDVPDAIDNIAAVGSADSFAGYAQSAAEGAVMSRLARGTIVGGGVETLRGGYQQLGRTDEMTGYLLGMLGYLKTLGRLSVTAMMDNRHDVAFPTPLIPVDIDRSDALFSAGRKTKYRAGAEAAWRVVQTMDNIRPRSRDENFYSKVCLTHIAIQTGATDTADLGANRMRDMCARIISRSILNADLNAERETMRRWAMSGR
jgi:hypothetical protein